MKTKISDLYLFYAIHLLILPLGFLIRTFYSNTISVEQLGVIYSLISTTTLIYFFTSLGLSHSMRYHVPKFEVKKQYKKIRNLFYYTFIIQITIALILSIVLLISSNIIAQYYLKEQSLQIFVQIFAFYFFSLVLFRNLKDIYNAHQHHKYSKIIGFTQMTSILIISLVIFFLGIHQLALYYAFAWGIATLITFLVFAIILIKKHPYLLKKPTYDKPLLKQHLKYSYYMLFTGFGTIILNQIDVIIVTAVLAVSQVAYYTNAFALIKFLAGSFAVFSIIFMPLFSELKEKKDFKTLNTILNTLYGILFFLILPISLTFFLFPDEFLKTLFGKEYVAGATVLAIFSFFSIFKVFSTYNMAFSNGLGKAKQLSKIVLPIALLNVILNLILIQFLGIVGVAIATIIGWILISTLTYRIISKEINFKLNIRKMIKTVLLAIVFIGLVLTLKNTIFILNNYITIAFILAFSFSIYLILGYLIKIYQLNDLYIFIPSDNLKKKLKQYHKKYLPYLK